MSDVLILGAGMVGVSTALALQAIGRDVVLVDRKPPGRETSYGNVGIIQSKAVEPHALPRDIPSLTRIALGRVDKGILESPRRGPRLASDGGWAWDAETYRTSTGH